MLDRLEQTMTTMLKSLELLVWQLGGTNNDYEEERKMPGDLPQGKHNPRLIHKDQPRQPLMYVKSVNEDELDRGHRAWYIITGHHNFRDEFQIRV